VLITTRRFGAPFEVLVSSSKLYSFPDALPGLPDSHRYALLDEEAYLPLRWLQSLDEDLVCLPVLALDALPMEGYPAHVAAAIGAGDDGVSSIGDHSIVLVIRFDQEEEAFVANLLAPVLLDHQRGAGKQVILEGTSYPLRQRLQWIPASRSFSLPC